MVLRTWPVCTRSIDTEERPPVVTILTLFSRTSVQWGLSPQASTKRDWNAVSFCSDLEAHVETCCPQGDLPRISMCLLVFSFIAWLLHCAYRRFCPKEIANSVFETPSYWSQGYSLFPVPAMDQDGVLARPRALTSSMWDRHPQIAARLAKRSRFRMFDQIGAASDTSERGNHHHNESKRVSRDRVVLGRANTRNHDIRTRPGHRLPALCSATTTITTHVCLLSVIPLQGRLLQADCLK